MRHLSSVAIGMTLALSFASPARASGDDVVLLNNGGRVRGTVVQEDPAQGVRIRLADGTIRNIASKDVKKVEYAGEPAPVEQPATAPAPPAPVAPAPPTAGVGAIHVETAAPATVVVDGGVIGKAPADVKAAAVGRHRVHVDFDDGGSREEIVLVQGGETAKVVLGLPETQEIFASHRGFHFGFAGELALVPFVISGAGTTFGAGGAFLVDYGISPAVDFRATAFVDLTGGTFAFIPIGASAGLRFNLGSTYTMGLAMRGGVGIIAGTNGSTPGPFVGPEASLVGFRFGDRRQFSIELTQRVGFYFFSGGFGEGGFASFENAISFSYLFLDAPGAKAAPANAPLDDR